MFENLLSHADAARARSAADDRRHPAGQGRLRGRGLHAGCEGVARQAAARRTSSCSSTSGRSGTRSSARARTCEYVFPFENRGVEVGVTLHHPHGQIYAYPFVPPIAARELAQQRAYFDAHGRGLLEDHLPRARSATGRSDSSTPASTCVALVPVCARYSYEVWIAPRRPARVARRSRRARSAPTSRGRSRPCCSSTTGSGSKPFPYIMVFHQAPTDGAPHPEAHVHVEFYPAYRMPERLKYLAGSEIGRRRVHRGHPAGREGRRAARRGGEP